MPSSLLTRVAVALSASWTWRGLRRGLACTSTAATPAMWGEDIDVPEAEALPPCGHGPMTLPVLSHEEEICTPGAVMSGEVEPKRSPRTTVWPSSPIGTARRLSCSRPLEEKPPRLRSRSLAATEITQGAWLKEETLASASSLPELPAEKTTRTSLSSTGL